MTELEQEIAHRQELQAKHPFLNSMSCEEVNPWTP